MIKNFIIVILLKLSLFSHTMVFNAIDNEDGTMEVIGMFSNGQSSEGANFKIISLATSKVIYEKRIPESGSLMVDIPKEAYKLILDSGPGHQIEQNGDIKPLGGFQTIKTTNINFAFYTTLFLSVLFIISGFVLQFFRIKKV